MAADIEATKRNELKEFLRRGAPRVVGCDFRQAGAGRPERFPRGVPA